MGPVPTVEGKMNRMEFISKFVYVLFMTICAVQDKRERAVRDSVYVLFSILGIICSVLSERNFFNILLAFIPGIVLLMISKLSGEALGMGDALFYMVSAMYIDIRVVFIMLLVSMFICGIISLFIIAYYGIGRRGRHEFSIPYLTILLPIGIFTLVL